MTEAELDKNTVLVTDLTRKVRPSHGPVIFAYLSNFVGRRTASESGSRGKIKGSSGRVSARRCGLKTFVKFRYRYRHAADKLQKTENVMEKYKKKLEESADLRRNIKVCTETLHRVSCSSFTLL